MLQEVGVLSYFGYFLSKGHSMAMRYSHNGGVGSRTVLIKLLINLRTSFWVLSVPRTAVLEHVVFAGKYGI